LVKVDAVPAGFLPACRAALQASSALIVTVMCETPGDPTAVPTLRTVRAAVQDPGAVHAVEHCPRCLARSAVVVSGMGLPSLDREAPPGTLTDYLPRINADGD
jgi:hypothetical protein